MVEVGKDCGDCATGTVPAGRILPNNIHGARLDGEKRSLEEKGEEKEFGRKGESNLGRRF